MKNSIIEDRALSVNIYYINVLIKKVIPLRINKVFELGTLKKSTQELYTIKKTVHKFTSLYKY